MQDFSPQKETLNAAGGTSDRLPCGPNSPFIYCWSGDYYGAEEEDGTVDFLPRVKRLPMVPGCNGVKGHFAHPQWAPMLSWLQQTGWQYIPLAGPVVYYEDGVLVEDDCYILSLPCRDPVKGTMGKCYLSVWDRPTVEGRGVHASVNWGTHRDNKGFRAWLRFLMDEGTIPRPTQGIVERALTLQRKRAIRHVVKAPGSGYFTGIVEREGVRLNAMLAAQKELESAAPKRKHKSKRRSGKGKPQKESLGV